jgi:hypothetical protein
MPRGVLAAPHSPLIVYLRSPLTHLLVYPLPPRLPLRILQIHLLPLIPYHLQPNRLPITLPSTPPRLAHQTDQRLLLCPALLARHVREICRAVAPSVVCP